MKIPSWFLCFLLSTFCFCAPAQYSLDWSTIDGGGGTSTGGVYSISGTIGQPDAGAMSGGNYTVQGGFWGIIATVQTPGAPILSILQTTTNTIVISWPRSSTGYVLHELSDLRLTDWAEVAPPPQEVDGHWQVVVPLPAANRFYRLIKSP